MQINPITLTDSYPKRTAVPKEVPINNNVKQNSVPSFKGLGEGAIAQKLARSKGFKNLLLYSNKNTLVIEAMYALLITCLLRPAVTLMTPAKTEVEKDKNKFRAAHAAASGALGFLFTVCFAHPISDAVDKIMTTKLPDGSFKYLQKHAEQLAVRDGKVFKELAKRIHQPVFMPLRAMATVALVPPMLAMFGIRKNKDEAQKNENTKQVQQEVQQPKLPAPSKFEKGGN
ncbi:hypothetical protein IKQ26_03985 [bacterium]|nr:hypothetical protein [bacterium]